MESNEGLRQKIAFRLVRKYIAGSTTASMLKVVKELNDKGMHSTVTLLKDHVTDAVKAKYNANAYAEVIRQMGRLGLNSSISIRPSQLGYGVDNDAFMKNIEELSAVAKSSSTKIWIEDEELVDRKELLGLYASAKILNPDLGIEVMVETDQLPAQLSSLGKGDSIRLWYTTKFRGKMMDAKAHQKLIAKLSASKASLTVSSHDIKWVSRMMGSGGLDKRNITFEVPLGYGIGKLGRLAKGKGAVSVYVPYGKDWADYIRSRIADGKIRGIAVKMLSDSDGKEKKLENDKNGKRAGKARAK